MSNANKFKIQEYLHTPELPETHTSHLQRLGLAQLEHEEIRAAFLKEMELTPRQLRVGSRFHRGYWRDASTEALVQSNHHKGLKRYIDILYENNQTWSSLCFVTESTLRTQSLSRRTLYRYDQKLIKSGWIISCKINRFWTLRISKFPWESQWAVIKDLIITGEWCSEDIANNIIELARNQFNAGNINLYKKELGKLFQQHGRTSRQQYERLIATVHVLNAIGRAVRDNKPLLATLGTPTGTPIGTPVGTPTVSTGPNPEVRPKQPFFQESVPELPKKCPRTSKKVSPKFQESVPQIPRKCPPNSKKVSHISSLVLIAPFKQNLYESTQVPVLNPYTFYNFLYLSGLSSYCSKRLFSFQTKPPEDSKQEQTSSYEPPADVQIASNARARGNMVRAQEHAHMHTREQILNTYPTERSKTSLQTSKTPLIERTSDENNEGVTHGRIKDKNPTQSKLKPPHIYRTEASNRPLQASKTPLIERTSDENHEEASNGPRIELPPSPAKPGDEFQNPFENRTLAIEHRQSQKAAEPSQHHKKEQTSRHKKEFEQKQKQEQRYFIEKTFQSLLNDHSQRSGIVKNGQDVTSDDDSGVDVNPVSHFNERPYCQEQRFIFPEYGVKYISPTSKQLFEHEVISNELHGLVIGESKQLYWLEQRNEILAARWDISSFVQRYEKVSIGQVRRTIRNIAAVFRQDSMLVRKFIMHKLENFSQRLFHTKPTNASALFAWMVTDSKGFAKNVMLGDMEIRRKEIDIVDRSANGQLIPVMENVGRQIHGDGEILRRALSIKRGSWKFREDVIDVNYFQDSYAQLLRVGRAPANINEFLYRSSYLGGIVDADSIDEALSILMGFLLDDRPDPPCNYIYGGFFNKYIW